MKLNIQMFAYTNTTENYDLPQYIGSDKPTYLGDFNTSMSIIDGALKQNADNIVSATSSASSALEVANTASTTAQIAKTSADTATGKAEQAQQTATTASSTASSALATATQNTQAIGETNANLEAFENYLTLTDFRDLTNPVVVQGGGSVTSNNMKVALNSNGTVGKIYGRVDITGATSFPRVEFRNTGIQVSEEIVINATGTAIPLGGSTEGIDIVNIAIIPPTGSQTSATIQIRLAGYRSGGVSRAIITPCLYFFKDFGDID